MMNQQLLLNEHHRIKAQLGTGSGVFSDTCFGFMPAFRNIHNKETHLSVYDGGHPSVVHLLDGLPDKWIDEKSGDGRPVSLKAGIIAGFMRQGRFYTLREIMQDLCDA